MRLSTRHASKWLALTTLTLALALCASTVANAGTYAFSIPAHRIALSGFEAGAHPGFRHTGNGIAATPGVTYPVNAIARAWIGLPAGGTFASLSGAVIAGSGNNFANGMKTNVLIQAPDGRTETVWNTILPNGYPTSTWAASPGFGAQSIRLGLRSPKQSACGSCATSLTAISGTVEDNTPPGYVTLSSPLAWHAVTDRSVSIGFELRDDVAGPAEIHAFVNGAYAGLLWAAGPADPGLLTRQRTAGSPVVGGAATVRLPDTDGAHTLQLHGHDAVGNATASNTFTVTLDRTPPTLDLAAPEGWCASPCAASISASDLTGITRATARLGSSPVPVTGGSSGGAFAGTVDLTGTGIEGTHTLTVTVWDALGHTSERSATVQLDNSPPLLENPIADPNTRRITVTATDTSDITTIHTTIAGQVINLHPAQQPGSYTANAPASVTDLDGTTIQITATDQLGNTATTNTRFAKRAKPALTARANRTTLTHGKKIRITGALIAPELPANSQITLRLAHPAWPSRDQHLAVTTDKDGRFATKITPEHSGTLTATYHGTQAHQPVTAALGAVQVKPRIRIKITGKHMRNGLVRRLRVRGTLTPADHPPLTLLWQAKPRRTKRWVTFCPDNNLITVTNGKIRGTCKLKGLHPNNQYRLALRPKPDSIYRRAQSNVRRVRRG